MNADNIKFRCSSLGYLMTEPKEKTPLQKYAESLANLSKLKSEYAELSDKAIKTRAKKLASIQSVEKTIAALSIIKDRVYLAETVRTHLVDVFVREKYNRFTEINAKQLRKGNSVEEDSITVVSRTTKVLFYKNEEQLSNDFIMGTPDIFTGESIYNADGIRDTKSSWDIFTFNRAISKPLDNKYYWQGMGYMALTGAEVCNIDYCLNNTPWGLIERELYMESNKHPENKTPDWIEAQIIANHVYDKKTFDEYLAFKGIQATDENTKAIILGFVEVPLEERHFSFEFERDEDAIERIYARVVDCRAWMNENLFKVKELVTA